MRVATSRSILEVGDGPWSALDLGCSPFLRFGFLASLECSGSVGEGTGWEPRYVLAWDGEQLVGAIPAWWKSHSYGEYIFDWAWADGAMRAGIPYYPKIVVGVPFTPATGNRLLLHPQAPPGTAAALLAGLRELADEVQASSVHWLFCEERESELLERLGYFPRETLQFHWRNPGWESFEDYLGAMRGKRRREIRRERRRLRDAGLNVVLKQGPELGDEEWAAMDRFYRDTTARKWGQAYLSTSFFSELRTHMPESVVFAAARRGDEMVGGALLFEGTGALYGRYWGCDETYQHLHFETCFYSPIEYCLIRGLTLYEAGAQGEHKLPRGFAPSIVRSVHWIREPRLAAAIDDFCAAERAQTRRSLEHLESHGAF